MNEITVPGKLIAYIMENPTNADGIRNEIALYASGVASEHLKLGYKAATEEAEKRLCEIANHAHDVAQLIAAASESRLSEIEQELPF